MDSGYIIIDSKKAIKNGADNNALSYNKYFNLQGVNYVALYSYDFLYNIDNVNDYNNTAYIDTGSQSFPVIIPNGNYTGITLAPAIKSALDGLGLGVWSVGYTTEKFVITGPIIFKFIQGPNEDTNWSDMCGFEKYDFNLSLSNSSVYPVDLVYTNSVYIVSNILHSDKYKVDSSTNLRNNILGIVYVKKNKDLGENVKHHITEYNHVLKWIKTRDNRDLQNIDIQLFDDNGRPLNGTNYNYVLTLMTK